MLPSSHWIPICLFYQLKEDGSEFPLVAGSSFSPSSCPESLVTRCYFDKGKESNVKTVQFLHKKLGQSVIISKRWATWMSHVWVAVSFFLSFLLDVSPQWSGCSILKFKTANRSWKGVFLGSCLKPMAIRMPSAFMQGLQNGLGIILFGILVARLERTEKSMEDFSLHMQRSKVKSFLESRRRGEMQRGKGMNS